MCDDTPGRGRGLDVDDGLPDHQVLSDSAVMGGMWRVMGRYGEAEGWGVREELTDAPAATLDRENDKTNGRS